MVVYVIVSCSPILTQMKAIRVCVCESESGDTPPYLSIEPPLTTHIKFEKYLVVFVTPRRSTGTIKYLTREE